jgi:hypothetical protein
MGKFFKKFKSKSTRQSEIVNMDNSSFVQTNGDLLEKIQSKVKPIELGDNDMIFEEAKEEEKVKKIENLIQK